MIYSYNKIFSIGFLFFISAICIFPFSFLTHYSISAKAFCSSPLEEEWIRTYTLGSWDSEGRCIQSTPDGGYVVSGSRGGAEIYYLSILKVDSQGIEQWNRSFGSGGIGVGGNWVENTNDHGYIVAGWMDSRYYVIKVDSQGNFQWDVLGQEGGANCVKQTRDGGYIVSGGVGPSLILVKYDSTGDEIWSKTYSSNNSLKGFSVMQTSEGGYIVTGTNGYSLLLIKTDADGLLAWEKEYFTTPWPGSCGKSVLQTSDGGYIVGGFNSSDQWPTDMLLLKTDAQGNEEWHRTFGTHGYGSWDYGYTVIELSNGNYIFGGVLSKKIHLFCVRPNGTVDWDQEFLSSHDILYRHICLDETLDQGIIITGALDADYTTFILKLGVPKAILGIVNVTGGVRIKAELINFESEVPAYNVTWSIHVQGGILKKINLTTSGTVPVIYEGNNTHISIKRIFGLGEICIVISAQADNALMISAIRHAKIFGYYIYYLN